MRVFTNFDSSVSSKFNPSHSPFLGSTRAKLAMTTTQVPVLIVGGGIVGLSASLFLSSHGVKSFLVERHAGTSIHPRARGLNRRTMEIYRGIGIDGDVREAGACLAPSAGIYKGQSLVGVINAITRNEDPTPQRVPGAGYFEFLGPVDGIRGTQDMIEPVLLAEARNRGGDLRFNFECVAFEQDDDAVIATLRERSKDTTMRVRAAYMIAADGAGSRIRQDLGLQVTGAGPLGHLLNILFEADLSDLVRGREFSMCLIDRSDVRGLFTSINNHDRWVFHLSYDPRKGEHIESFSAEVCEELIKVALGLPDTKVVIKSILPWEPTVAVSKSSRQGRVFLAGDAAHQMPPWGGQGANTGIADVHNLAWKLAAVIQKSANAQLLDTYEPERLPIGQLVAGESGAATDDYGLFSMSKNLSTILGLLRRAPRLAGYGYSYTSRGICTEDDTPAISRIMRLLPSISQILRIDGAPGVRLPHLWVQYESRCISTLDLVIRSFVIFAGNDGEDWIKASSSASASLGFDVLAHRVGPTGSLVAPKAQWEAATGISSKGAILVRPDGFVAWRVWGALPDVDRKLERVLKQVLCY